MTLKIILFSVAVIALIVGVIYTLTKPGGALSPYWAFLQGDRWETDAAVNGCDRDTNQKDLQAKCEANPECIGYTMFWAWDNTKKEMYWKPRCMKTAKAQPLDGTANYQFFPKPKL